MFYLFILESIGTSELLLIGLVALIIFGPRKLPEFAKMLGKARNEFKRTTDEFKETWEREVSFENEEKSSPTSAPLTSNSIQRTENEISVEIAAPEIKEVSQADFDNYSGKNNTEQKTDASTDKRDWL